MKKLRGGGMFGQDDNQGDDHGLFSPRDDGFNDLVSDTDEHHPVAVHNGSKHGSRTPAAPQQVSTDELLDIKQDALQALSPLIGHLDQSPEEKFRTTMMMIQASDDQSLIKEAYSAAKRIRDEKARAQALLDVVNEINYFTQQHAN